MEGEGGGVGFVAIPGEDISISHRRVAEVFGVDAAVGVEAFGEAHADEGAAGAADVEDDVADHVLAHVVDDGVGFVGGSHRDWVEGVGDGDGEVGLGGEFYFGGDFGGDGVGPVFCGEVGGVPAGGFEACVVDFAGVDFGEECGGGGGLPGFVGGDDFVGTVGEGDVELCPESVGVGVLAGAGPGHGGAVPAGAEDGGDGVVAWGEHPGDVVGLVEDAFVEIGPAGVEESVRGDGLAVQECLVGSEGGDGEACGLDGGGDGEVFAEECGFGGDAVGAGDFGVAVGADG